MVTFGRGVVPKSWLHECVRGAGKRIEMAAWMYLFWEGSWSTKPCFFV